MWKRTNVIAFIYNLILPRKPLTVNGEKKIGFSEKELIRKEVTSNGSLITRAVILYSTSKIMTTLEKNEII